ncbi:MAG: ABC transporter ATP-binding protein [Dehalococcoidia bacterium]|nr:ABC transporter ATP-binding protein [Dehalococcoidia bacterium]
MAYWGGGGPSGWSGGGPGEGPGGARRGRTDGWDYDELGKVYDPALFRRLVPFMAPFKGRAIMAVIAMAIYSATSYAQPYVIGRGIEHLRSNPNTADLAVVGYSLVGLAVVSWLTQWWQRLMTGYIGHHMLLDLRNRLFNHLQKLSLRFYDNQEVGRVMSRVTSDVVVLQELLTTGLLNVLADFLGLGLIVFFLVALDWQLALVSMSVIPVMLVFMWWWQRRAASTFIRVRQAIALVNSNINENVSGVRVVQSLGREGKNLEEFERLNRMNLSSNLDASKLQAAVMPMVELLSTVATVLVLLVIGVRLASGSLSADSALGFAVAFTLYIQRFFNPVRDIVLQYTQLQRATAGAHRVFELLDWVPEIQDAPDAVVMPDIRGRVDFNHVDFSYIEGVPVLRDFDLHVQPGETIALVGHTGAGKTSVTALINRSYEITGGSIEIDGVDLRQIERASLTRRMSVVLQEPYLFSGTIADNIRYGRLDATDDDVHRAAEAVGANVFIERLPLSYATELHERGQNLSVGQRQLIAFARAIIAEPRILILDEATANVDTQTERVIQRALQVLLRGRTSFVIAHRLSTIRDATRIVVMEAGHIAEIGSHEELMRHGGIYADLYRMTYSRQGEGAIAVAGDGS